MTDPWQNDPDRTTRRETPVQTVIETRRGRTVVALESVAPGERRHEAQRLFQPVDTMPGQTGMEI